MGGDLERDNMEVPKGAWGIIVCLECNSGIKKRAAAFSPKFGKSQPVLTDVTPKCVPDHMDNTHEAGCLVLQVVPISILPYCPAHACALHRLLNKGESTPKLLEILKLIQNY